MSESERLSMGVYEGRARQYAAMNEHSAYNALYERPAAIELVGDVAGKRVLDAGCGAGPLTQRLVEKGARVVGIDTSRPLLEIARERGLRDVSFHLADLRKPLSMFSDGAFDAVISSLVLHYLRDWVPVLGEFHRVLVPGGSLVLSTHHPAWDVSLSATGNYFDTELVTDRWLICGEEVDVHFWRRPLTDMFSAFAAAGFAIETMQEPMPVDDCRLRFPDIWEVLRAQPAFVFFRLRPAG